MIFHFELKCPEDNEAIALIQPLLHRPIPVVQGDILNFDYTLSPPEWPEDRMDVILKVCDLHTPRIELQEALQLILKLEDARNRVKTIVRKYLKEEI